MKSELKHVISGQELSQEELHWLLQQAAEIKQNPKAYQCALNNKFVLLMFEKPSFRTKLSFTVAIKALGGEVLVSDSETRKAELPADQIRVLQGYCDALMLRTHDENTFKEMIEFAKIPIINGLSKHFHPCQILADLFTLNEIFPSLEGLKICYVGDGNNILNSLLLIATKFGIQIHYACPAAHQPPSAILQQSDSKLIKSFLDPNDAVQGCDVIYTDVWTSMGCKEKDLDEFSGFQVNEQLVAQSGKNPIVMHCMPMNRGIEISPSLPEQPYSVIFQQSENRLYVQKALLLLLLGGEPYHVN